MNWKFFALWALMAGLGAVREDKLHPGNPALSLLESAVIAGVTIGVVLLIQRVWRAVMTPSP